MPHIEIENAMALFMGTEAAISYSDSASCEASTVPAFAKRGDLIVADSDIHHAIQTGVELSRAKVCVHVFMFIYIHAYNVHICVYMLIHIVSCACMCVR